MLFISRQTDYGYWGVYDTDDGVEEIVHHDAIAEALKSGVAIQGAAIAPQNRWNLILKPYQLPSTMTRLQIKLWSLYGVETVVFGDKLAHINWCSLGILSPVSIRLSELCTSFSYNFVRCDYQEIYRPITLVFDDNIIATRDDMFVLSDCIYPGKIKVDFREVHNIRLLEIAYEQICRLVHPYLINELVLDNPVRQSELCKRSL